jgi:hypothetical protein
LTAILWEALTHLGFALSWHALEAPTRIFGRAVLRGVRAYPRAAVAIAASLRVNDRNHGFERVWRCVTRYRWDSLPTHVVTLRAPMMTSVGVAAAALTYQPERWDDGTLYGWFAATGRNWSELVPTNHAAVHVSSHGIWLGSVMVAPRSTAVVDITTVSSTGRRCGMYSSIDIVCVAILPQPILG